MELLQDSMHEDLPVLLDPSSTNNYDSDLDVHSGPGIDSSGVISINPVTVLGAGRIDPFAHYPIKMNTGELWLIDQGT